jgi:hypothetical protein
MSQCLHAVAVELQSKAAPVPGAVNLFGQFPGGLCMHLGLHAVLLGQLVGAQLLFGGCASLGHKLHSQPLVFCLQSLVGGMQLAKRCGDGVNARVIVGAAVDAVQHDER